MTPALACTKAGAAGEFLQISEVLCVQTQVSTVFPTSNLTGTRTVATALHQRAVTPAAALK